MASAVRNSSRSPMLMYSWIGLNTTSAHTISAADPAQPASGQRNGSDRPHRRRTDHSSLESACGPKITVSLPALSRSKCQRPSGVVADECGDERTSILFINTDKIAYSKTVKSRTVSTGQKGSKSTYSCPKR